MSQPINAARRAVLRDVAAGLSLAPLAMLATRPALGADLPPLSESDPAAQAVQYVEDASRAKAAAQGGANCSNCALFNAESATAPEGTCSVFPGKLVKAAGWCNKWSTL